MITPAFGLIATERVLPKLALDFTTATLDPRVTFTRTTGAANPATYIDSSGVITAATNNQPRFDYDPSTLVCKGLLIEESRTNSLLNTDLLSTQIVVVTAAVRTLSFYGTGVVTLSGTHTAVVTGTGAYPTRTTHSFTPTAGALTLTVTGTVQYAQLEAGAFATSYIPTTAAALTRNADVATMTGTNFSDWYNQTEGTFAVQASATNTSGSPRYVGASDGTVGNRIVLLTNSNTQTQNIVSLSGSTQANILCPTTDTRVATKVCLAYKVNDFAASTNAGTVVTDTAGAIPTTTTLYIGALENGTTATNMLNGHVKNIRYYPMRLLNAELQAFSK